MSADRVRPLVLLVDDEPLNLKLATVRLRDAGFEVETAADGAAALTRARSLRPDAVVSDVLMPGLDGFALCRELRRDPALAAVPVVLASASYVEEADRRLAEEMGASALVLRTPDLALVIAALRAAIAAGPASSPAGGTVNEELYRERLQSQLLRQTRRYQALMEQASDAILVVDPEGRILEINAAAERLFGWEAADAVGKSYLGFVVPEEREESAQMFRRLVAEGSLRLIKRSIQTREGGRVQVEISSSLVHLGEETVAVVVLRDVTERHRVERALRESEERNRRLLQRLEHVVGSSPSVLFALRPEREGFVGTWVSPNVERLLGFTGAETLASGWWRSQIHPDDRERVLAELSELPARRFLEQEYRLHHRDGSYRWLRAELRVTEDGADGVEVIGSWSDVTERRQLETRLHQSQRIESIGRLAGGVAHDFNNLLTVISGYGELLRAGLGDQELLHYVEDLLLAADRAAALTRQLLAFSRRQVVQPRVLDLNQVVVETEKMLRRLIGEDVLLESTLTAPLWRLQADPGQLEQVLMNLAVNARDAMPRGGRLTIETRHRVVDAAYARLNPGLRPGEYVALVLTDTGHGMTPEVRAQIFEPFFTTKEPGRGTGLGLATVHGIVTQAGGYVLVYSEPEQGTTFEVLFPRVDDPAAAVTMAGAASAALPGGHERVLLVEDDSGVRGLVRELLERFGYAIVEARDGKEALALCAKQQQPADLLMTDLVMPGMDGRELATRVRERWPAVKVLYMSGYTDDAVVLHGVLSSGTPFLHKPFNAASLARAVRDALDRAEG
jgi:PAS domain S-box-containing protein